MQLPTLRIVADPWRDTHERYLRECRRPVWLMLMELDSLLTREPASAEWSLAQWAERLGMAYGAARRAVRELQLLGLVALSEECATTVARSAGAERTRRYRERKRLVAIETAAEGGSCNAPGKEEGVVPAGGSDASELYGASREAGAVTADSGARPADGFDRSIDSDRDMYRDSRSNPIRSDDSIRPEGPGANPALPIPIPTREVVIKAITQLPGKSGDLAGRILRSTAEQLVARHGVERCAEAVACTRMMAARDAGHEGPLNQAMRLQAILKHPERYREAMRQAWESRGRGDGETGRGGDGETKREPPRSGSGGLVDLRGLEGEPEPIRDLAARIQRLAEMKTVRGG
jgi:hypothetical protein